MNNMIQIDLLCFEPDADLISCYVKNKCMFVLTHINCSALYFCLVTLIVALYHQVPISHRVQSAVFLDYEPKDKVIY